MSKIAIIIIIIIIIMNTHMFVPPNKSAHCNDILRDHTHAASKFITHKFQVISYIYEHIDKFVFKIALETRPTKKREKQAKTNIVYQNA